MEGLVGYLVPFVIFACIYAVLSLGLNMQWGLTGLFNIGIVAFAGAGAYTSALITRNPSDIFGLGLGLPFPFGLAGAMIVAAILALFVGWITIRLRADYLAIATIGIGEIVRLFLKNEDWLTNGVRGMDRIDRPFIDRGDYGSNLVYMVVVLAIVVAVYWVFERARRSPWGRVLRAVRDNELTAMAAGKNIVSYRLQAFVLGAAVMGLGGALWGHFVGFISPEAFMPMQVTFLTWVMLIAGGSGNNKGAILGALVIWTIWSGSQIVTGYLPNDWSTQAGAIRMLLVGLMLVIVLLYRPEGILSEGHQREQDIRRQQQSKS